MQFKIDENLPSELAEIMGPECKLETCHSEPCSKPFIFAQGELREGTAKSLDFLSLTKQYEILRRGASAPLTQNDKEAGYLWIAEENRIRMRS